MDVDGLCGGLPFVLVRGTRRRKGPVLLVERKEVGAIPRLRGVSACMLELRSDVFGDSTDLFVDFSERSLL